MNNHLEQVKNFLQRIQNRNVEASAGQASAGGLPVPVRPTSRQNILSDEQRLVYERMESSGEIMFITGKAGTGKSFLLKYFVENTHKKTAVVAPTGMAAINVGGQTIHSFFHLAPEVQIPKNAEPITSSRLKHLLRRVEVIVIDEVSMVRVDLMDMIDTKLQLANGNSRPFGGKQVIMFGDPYQLPPVVENDDEAVFDYLMNTYKSQFFFSAPVFEKHPVVIHELSGMFRQTDREFIDILNKVRDGNISRENLDALNRRCHKAPDDKQEFLTLVPTNWAANKINQEKLRSIPAQMFRYTAEITGKMGKSEYPTDVELELKVGARVVMLENRSVWVNGTLGVISYLDEGFIRVTIRGVDHTVDRKVWEKRRYFYDRDTDSLKHEVIATFTQYPVKLAWAMTIHKAQGQTYKSVAIDMGGGAFEAGQAYVALSRCVSMDTLYLLRPIQLSDIKTSSAVAEFMRNVNMNGSCQIKCLE